MPAYRLGCHPYVFDQYGWNQTERLDEVFDTVAACGYPAIELHSPMLDRPDWFEAITAACHRTGLEIIGGSNGGQLWDASQWEQIHATMDVYSQKLSRFGGVKCGFSAGGKRLADRNEAENGQVIRAWTELGTMCQSRGVALNYHTHGEPPEDVQFVIDNVPADILPLGPDLDWLRFGGGDPEAFIRANIDRIVMLHIRDYHLGGERTWALGEGDADYARLAKVLDEVGFTGDFVVELAITGSADPASRPVEELLRQSREHIRETMGL